jgi:pilus assembly protein CpaB
MNKRIVAVLLFAFVIAVAASGLLYYLLVNRMPQQQEQVVTRVLVANRNLAIGAMVRDIDIREADWVGPVPEGALLNRDDIIDRGVVQNVYAGEPILETRLAAKGAGAGLAATIPPGMRAVAVRMNQIVGVSGFVIPGSRIDLLISGTPPGGTPGNTGTLITTLMQNLEVLSAGQQIEKDAEGKPVNVNVVNMLVTPEQAETLSLATNETRIQMVLRNPLDTEESDPPGTAASELWKDIRFLQKPEPVRRAPVRVANPTPPPPPVARPEPPLTVEIIHGVRKQSTQFQQKREDNQ